MILAKIRTCANVYYVDVVNQRLRREADSEWIAYRAIRGSGIKGETLTIVWEDDELEQTVTSPVQDIAFIQVNT